MPDENPDKKKKPKSRRVGQVVERIEGEKYLVRIFRGYKPNGQNDYFNKTIHGTKTDAEKWLRDQRSRRAVGPDVVSAPVEEDSRECGTVKRAGEDAAL